VVGLLWFPLLGSLYLGLGLFGLLATSVLLSFVYSSLIPLAGPAGDLGGGAALAAAGWACLGAVVAIGDAAELAGGAAQRRPAASSGRRHRRQPLGGVRRSAVPAEPAAGRRVRREARGAFPWLPPRAMAFVAPAPKLDAPGPDLVVEQDSNVEGKRHVRLR